MSLVNSLKYESLSQSEEYRSFRSKVPLRKMCVDHATSKVWHIYDAGPRTVRSPLVCLPSAGGTADMFFLQLTTLAAKNIRVIAMSYPEYTTVSDWCEGFRKVLDALDVDTPHLMGVSLGGFLAQKFCEHTRRCSRVSSLLLCNSYSDTSDVIGRTAMLHWMLPMGALRGLVASVDDHGCSHYNSDMHYNFSVDQLHSLTQPQLSSRLSLVLDQSYVQPNLVTVKVTLLDVFSGCAVREKAKNSLLKSYPDARLAYFKEHSTMPYMSDPDAFNMYIMVHLKEFSNTPHDAYGSPGPST